MSEAASEQTPIPPPPAPVPVPLRELGYAKTDTAGDWWATLVDEKVPELRWPGAYDVYDDMVNNPQVASVVRAVMMPILGTGWRVDGTGCREDITRHVANDLGLPIVGKGEEISNDLPIEERFSWGEHAEIALEESIKYGHSFWEQKAELGTDGLWHLSKLGYRPPRTIVKINVARDGGLVSIEQTNGGGVLASLSSAGNKVLPVNRIVVYSRGRRGSNWRGRALLRPAYQPWLLNQRAARIEMILAERAGAPLTVYTAAENEKDLSAGKKIATEARVGQNAGAAVAYGATLKQQGIEGTLPDIDKIKRYNDEAIARAVLAHVLTLGNETGSWALGDTLMDVFRMGIASIGKDLARVASSHVARDIVRWNWPGERAPRIVFDEIGARQDAIVHAIATLVQSGVLKPDEDLEQFIRTSLGLPPRNPNTPVPQEA